MKEDKTKASPDQTDLEEHVREIMETDTPASIPTDDIDIFKNQPDPLTAPLIKDAKVPSEPVATAEVETEAPAPEDPVVDEAVDDIVAKESDDLLAAEDKDLTKAFSSEKPSFKQKLRNFFSKWWQNKKLRWATILVLIGLLVSAAVIPASRYFILNTVGVRASASLVVYDDSTTQPLKNVRVKLAGQTAQTDNDGKVRLTHLKLGPTELTVEKTAFAVEKKPLTVGWGSNPLGDVKLHPVGAQYTFVVTDFLSGKGIDKAEASSGEANALSDDKGLIKLTVDPTDDDSDLKVIIKAEGYREEEITISLDDKQQHAVKLVPARKAVFVSKRSGKFDLYSMDIDGKNQRLVLAGTGTEREDITLATHPTDEVTVLVSSRDNKRNADGYLLSTLTLIDLKDNSSESLAQSERIQIVGWSEDRLVYLQVAAGASAADPRRERLVSYNYKTGQSQELASTNYFNDLLMANGKIYYAPSSSYQNGSGVGFFSMNSDGTNKQTILSSETWNLFRTAYDRLTVAVQQTWYDYRLGDKQASKLSGPPASLTSRVYTDSSDNKHSLWVDIRDGKGVLIDLDLTSQQEKVLQAKSGIKNPVRWLNNHTLIFRVNTDQETADYVMSIDGGPVIKVTDVTNTAGPGRDYGY